jgi:hypothetical protein
MILRLRFEALGAIQMKPRRKIGIFLCPLVYRVPSVEAR